MPYKVEKRTDGGLYYSFSGIVTPEDNLAARRKSFGENLENVTAFSYLIGDYSQTDNITHSTNDVQGLIKSLKIIMEKNPALVIAIVAPKDFVFGMSRMAQAFVGNEDRFMIFRTLDEAEIWVHTNRSKDKD